MNYMLKNYVFLFLTLMLSSVLPANAKNVSIGYLNYSLGENNEAKVTGMNTRNVSSIEIPDIVNDSDTQYTVTSIGYQAFSGYTNLVSVILPNSITSIGGYAFSNCTNLAEINLPESITSIGFNAFADCSSLTAITIPGQVKTIPYSIFCSCKKLSSISLPEGLIAIEAHAFAECPITSINIPQSVTTIGGFVFYGCRKLKSLTIPRSVKSIANYTFLGCNNLNEVVFEDGDEIIELGDNETTGMFDGCRLNSVYIGRNIDYRVPPFHNFKYLKTITIGSPITSLPGSFFYGSAIEKFITYSLNIDGLEYCSLDPSISAVVKTHTNFTGISSSNLTWFKNLTFEVDGENYGLVKGDDCLKFDNSIFSEADIDILPLQNCRAHMSDENSNKKVFFRGRDISVQLLSPQGFEFMPDSVHAKNVFTVYSDENPSTSRRVDLSEPGTLFDEIGLQNIEKIEMLTLSGNINGTDILTINRMTALKYLDMYDANIVEGGMTYRDNYMTKKDVIGSYFFNDVNLEVLRLPNTVNEINEYALSNEAYLKSLTIGSATTKIGKNAFEDCKSLTTITIPSSVKRIENNVFKNCTGLTELIMPYGPDALYLGDRIFSSTSWKEQFYDCPLETVYLGRDLSTSNTFANKKTLAKVTIADGVTSIVDGCFSDCTGLAEISLPNSIKKIGRSAFSKCSGLSIMDIPDSLETLGSRAFLGCTGIEKIVIPNSVTSIGEYCFSLCENLSDIEIASSVTEINDGAFNSCTGLKHIVFSDGPTPLRLGKTVNGKD